MNRFPAMNRPSDATLAAIRALVHRAVKSGDLERQPCLICGYSEFVEAHHEDYTSPLDVVWLCRFHHRGRHAYGEHSEQIASARIRPRLAASYDLVRGAKWLSERVGAQASASLQGEPTADPARSLNHREAA